MLPSVSSVLDGISRQRALDGESQREEEADGAEDTLARCMCTLSVQSNSVALQTKAKDPRVSRSFAHACSIPSWADSIDREYDEIEERKT